jgi:RNA polymerase sigma-54 factor
MKPSLSFKMSQSLALTPQLQQSIKLLQLSTLELHQEVGQMLEQNPFLEEEEDSAPLLSEPLTPTTQLATTTAEDSRSSEAPTDAADQGSDDPFEFTSEHVDDLNWTSGEETSGDDYEWGGEAPARQHQNDDEERGNAADWASTAGSLQDHLMAQTAGMRLSRLDEAALRMLIESLNEDGYLEDSLEEIAESVMGDMDLEQREDWSDRMNCALKWLQSMEPAGVGARSLGECLRLQLLQKPDTEDRDWALKICDAHLDLLARRDFKKIAQALGGNEARAKAAHQLILQLNPKPASAFGGGRVDVVLPDVLVVKRNFRWVAMLNPEVMPKLRINDIYAQALKQHRGTEGAQALSTRLQEARWFVKNIQQRFDTILRVSNAIVERQRSFFTHGEISMKPLVLREIADELGMHESTISRVTTAKYMATSFGVFELKYFFGSGLGTETGVSASSTAVRALIKQLVSAEDAKKPLSDSDIADLLGKQGIQCARRTVAKYRDALKIAPANMRKALS